jgi:hypothetical protein
MRAKRGAARQWIEHYVADPPQTDECVIWPFARLTANGHAVCQDWRTGRNTQVYRLIWELTNGRRFPERSQGRHSCGGGDG